MATIPSKRSTNTRDVEMYASTCMVPRGNEMSVQYIAEVSKKFIEDASDKIGQRIYEEACHKARYLSTAAAEATMRQQQAMNEIYGYTKDRIEEKFWTAIGSPIHYDYGPYSPVKSPPLNTYIKKTKTVLEILWDEIECWTKPITLTSE